MSLNDDIKALQERKNKLAAEIRELAEFGQSEAGFNPDQRTKWETINEAYDGIIDEMSSCQERVDIAARAASLEEKMDRQASAWQTEVGEARETRAGRPTEEHRAFAVELNRVLIHSIVWLMPKVDTPFPKDSSISSNDRCWHTAEFVVSLASSVRLRVIRCLGRLWMTRQIPASF
jgi:hypothetical protein